MNAKWPLWIAASINRHFETELPSVKIFYEGQHRDPTNVDNDNFVELRFNGPYFEQQSPQLWKLKYHINFLCQVMINDTQMYDIWTVAGLVAKAMVETIPLFNYENGVTPSVQFGCLQRTEVKNNDILIHYFGQVEPATKKLQATVEAHYYTLLEG